MVGCEKGGGQEGNEEYIVIRTPTQAILENLGQALLVYTQSAARLHPTCSSMHHLPSRIVTCLCLMQRRMHLRSRDGCKYGRQSDLRNRVIRIRDDLKWNDYREIGRLERPLEH